MTDTQKPEKQKFPAAVVLPLAERCCEMLESGTLRAAIAGSLRRRLPEVGDVEIVVEPVFDTDLFGNALPTSPSLGLALERCLSAGLLAWDTGTPRNGPRYKRFRFPALGLPLDLFIAGAGNWGNILAIRTGDADFSRLLVTQRFKGGLLPNWMRHGEGRLFARAKGYPDYRDDPAPPNAYPENVVPCPTEAAFFRHLWLDVPPMSLRNADGARQLSTQAIQNQKGWRK